MWFLFWVPNIWTSSYLTSPAILYLLLWYSNFFFFTFTLFFFTILYWFCHTLTWISHGCTWVPNPEPPSHFLPHIISLDHPCAPAPSILYPVSNIDWRFGSYMIVYMFQCHSPKSSLSHRCTEWTFFFLIIMPLLIISFTHFNF